MGLYSESIEIACRLLGVVIAGKVLGTLFPETVSVVFVPSITCGREREREALSKEAERSGKVA